VYDDFDLPLGKLRMREQGSAGTHNGMRSIVGELGNQKFARLRVGIGDPSRNAVGHVLSRFAQDEQRILDEVLDAAADAVEDWASDGANRAANRWNAWVPASLAADEKAGSDEATGVATPTEHAADGSEIVRSTTGWRKLLNRG